jgi:hypothetical protein
MGCAGLVQQNSGVAAGDGEPLTAKVKCPKKGCGETGIVTGTKRWRDNNGGKPGKDGKIWQSVQLACHPSKGLRCAATTCYADKKEVKYTPIEPRFEPREKPKPKTPKPPKKDKAPKKAKTPKAKKVRAPPAKKKG